MKKAEFEFVVRSVTEQMVGFLMEDYKNNQATEQEIISIFEKEK